MQTIRMTVAALVAALGLAAGAQTVVPVVNAAFEDVQDGRPVGWRPSSGGVWRTARGEGLNGSGALIWESAEPQKTRATCSQMIAVEPGMEYRISTSLRTQDFEGGKGAKVVLQFFNANGKEIGGVYPLGVKAKNADWCLSDEVAFVPEGTEKMRIALSVLPGAKGKVVFDEIRLEKTVRPVVSYVFSSAYRNLAKDGRVTFNAFLNLTAAQRGRATAAFVFRDAAGGERRIPARIYERYGEIYATSAAEVSELAMGEQQIRCEVLGLADAEGTTAACAFTRVAELPKRRVEIDPQGRCRVNGKPFFPIGMYSHFLSEKDAERYVEGPFNSVVVYGLSSPEHLKVLEKRGIMYLATLKNEIPGKSHATQRGIRTQAESDAFFRERIALLRDCPNLLGWYVCDEAPLSEVAARRHLYDLYRAADADHPCWAVMDKPASMREWVAICDVYGIDPYPIQKKRTPHSEPPVVDFCAKLNVAVCGARPFWNVPQNFNWAWYGRESDSRFPTDAELRFFNWAHIACGANGLIGYSFSPFCMEKYAKYDAYARHWKSVCAAYEDVKRLTDVLLADPFPVTGGTVHTPVRAWRKDGKVYVLACNAKAEMTDVTVRLGGAGWRVAALELGDAATPVRVSADGSVVFTLPFCGVALVRMDAEI